MCCIFIISSYKENKTVIAEGEKIEGGVSKKHLFERGQKGVFGLYVRLQKLNENLQKIGFEILENASQKQIEIIKKLILEKVQNLDINEDFLLSKYLSEQLNKEYSNISKIFSQTENITLEQYFILQKIEKVKELLIYRELTLSQIADKLGYKTVQHLSQQFKKTTGFSPSQFQELKEKKRLPIDFI